LASSARNDVANCVFYYFGQFNCSWGLNCQVTLTTKREVDSSKVYRISSDYSKSGTTYMASDEQLKKSKDKK
jgi:hypothetical protein